MSYETKEHLNVNTDTGHSQLNDVLRPSTEVVIRVSNISKRYQIYTDPSDRLRQMVWQGRRQFGQEFWALQRVSFYVHRGETIGIIGKNGSGKSTLLQIIAGTLAPTIGEVTVNGRVAALLELGSGFNPEFTGRENIALNGAILGMSREEMADRFDTIASFADIGEFMDQPVKLYSSGMFARLAFSIGIHTEPDVFIIDEALSVGDIFFQSRCMRKLNEYCSNGGTVLFVTHDTYTVERICSRAILLQNGEKRFEGDVTDAIKQYYQLERRSNVADLAPGVVPQVDLIHNIDLRREYVTGNRSAYISQVSILNDNGNPQTNFAVSEWMTVIIQAEFYQDFDEFDFGVGIRDKAGILLAGAHTFYQNEHCGPVRAGEKRLLKVRMQMSLAPTTYLLLIGLAQNESPDSWEDIYVLWDCCIVEVHGRPKFWGQVEVSNQITT